MQQIVQISTPSHNGLFDITRQVEAIVTESGVRSGMVNVYAQGATSAIMILFFLMYPLYCKVYAK
ncbi:MAG: YjbQ family protein [Bacteroidales bacterium]|nr:YjbQ family protein [Bacteroidales bacterium]